MRHMVRYYPPLPSPCFVFYCINSSYACFNSVGPRRSNAINHPSHLSVKLAGYRRACVAFATANVTTLNVPAAFLLRLVHPSIPLTARIHVPLPSRLAMPYDAPRSLISPSATRRAQHDHPPYHQHYRDYQLHWSGVLGCIAPEVQVVKLAPFE